MNTRPKVVSSGANRCFSRYVANFITPVLADVADDGELAIILNHELDEWEIEAGRPDGAPFAALAVACLREILSDLRERIKSKIATAEAVLQGIAA